MKGKIENYLNSKDKSEYSNLDMIFELYLNGKIKTLLSNYLGINIYPTFNKLNKSIQLNYNYHNIYVTIDFFEDKYNVVIYPTSIDAKELKKLFIDYDYQNNFSLEELINEIDIKIKSHPKLMDITLIKKKKKIYSIISWISLCLPIIIFGSIALYCVITKSSVKGNMWWIIFFIIIPLIIWFIFDIKSKKLK